MNFKNKSLGAFLGLGVAVLAIITIIVYLIYATSAEGLMMPFVLVCLIAVVALEALTFFVDNDFAPVAVAGLSVSALGCFAVDPPATLGSIVDYFQQIVMFGNPEKFGIIMTVAVLCFVTAVVAVVACFFDRTKQA